jgi:hypothetical protein
MIRFWAYHICASLFCIARSWAGYQAAPEAVGMSLAYGCRDEATMEWMLRAGSWKGTKVNVDFRGLIPSSATTPSFCGEIGMSAPYFGKMLDAFILTRIVSLKAWEWLSAACTM